MLIQSKIEAKLQQEFEPVHLEVVNESGNHNVPAGSESHFKLVVVSHSFDGQNLVGRHRLVNKVLADELQNGVHALAMKLMTPQQWQDAGHSHDHSSPKCMHK